MKNALKSIAMITGGVFAGLTIAHFVNSTERGREFFEDVNEFAAEFVDAVKQGYEARTEAIYAAIESGQGRAGQ
ncbi:hypothetical protein [Gulosibacter bifidus]|uniref:Uncharacterized protein n=1 Tax=Gulosibacter bifidus TaxID=272239 RepID=A0ABW5RH25_9MICO|nr:hypothetical protein [Gulosibacter bifidus]